LCLRDGDLETPEVRVERSNRPPIIKKNKTPLTDSLEKSGKLRLKSLKN